MKEEMQCTQRNLSDTHRLLLRPSIEKLLSAGASGLVQKHRTCVKCWNQETVECSALRGTPVLPLPTKARGALWEGAGLSKSQRLGRSPVNG